MRNARSEQILYFLIYVLLQLPIIHRFVLFDSAFAFFYISFLLVLPLGQNKLTSLLIAFGIGLLIDIFSNTPGVHASASLVLVVLRKFWLVMVAGTPEDDARVSIYVLGLRTMIMYALPLVFVHHFLIFLIEHGSFSPFGLLLQRSILSALLTTILFLTSNFLLSPKARRL